MLGFTFAERTNWPLSSNRITEALNKLKSEKIPFIDLTESNPTRCDFCYPASILSALSNRQNFEYHPDPCGMLAPREAIVRYYKEKGISISAEQIFLTASTSEAYSYLFRLAADPGERILLPRPSYPLFQFLVDLNDLKSDEYFLHYENGWHMDLEHLQRSITKDTKAIMLVNPNNPTGSFIKKQELDFLNEICQKHGLAIICDEVFADFSWDQRDHLSLVNNQGVLTFVLSGLSKTLALPQMKLSWIIVSGPSELCDEADERLEIIADTYLSVNTPTQNAADQWLLQRDQIQKQILKRITENFKYLKEATAAAPCVCLESDGGWYAVLKLVSIHQEEQFVIDLLVQDHVYVHPGYFYDFEGDAYLVLSLLPVPRDFTEGVRRIVNRVKQVPS